jgi:hypothetical protein
VLAYKIFGLEPGFAEGLLFYSCVPDLQSHPDLWLDECPYLQPTVSTSMPAGVRVELVSTEPTALRPAARPSLNPSHPVALAA